MPLIHDETIKATLNEQEILGVLQRAIESKYYEIKYGSYELKSAIFSVDDTGCYQCEILYNKIHKTVDDILESK